MDSGITAEMIAHSKAPDGSEMISIKTNAPKFLDAEIEKHRMISSNSSSDRAIPMNKMVERPWFNPVDIRLNEKGMQGYRSTSELEATTFRAALSALHQSVCDMLSLFPHIHKQHLNRYLLGFSFQSKIMTGTLDQWEYLLNLRDSPDADPAVQDLAKCIKVCIAGSKPVSLGSGSWHVPYYKDGHWMPLHANQNGVQVDEHNNPLDVALKISAARCARTSYDNFTGGRSVKEEDIKLHDWLVNNFHETPLEHQATPMKCSALGMCPELEDFSEDAETGVTHLDRELNQWSANYKGWIQYRKTL